VFHRSRARVGACFTALRAYLPLYKFKPVRLNPFKLRFWEIRPEALEALEHYLPLEALKFGPMTGFKRARAYKSVHKAKQCFSAVNLGAIPAPMNHLSAHAPIKVYIKPNTALLGVNKFSRR
jgi:hypothetical protein